MSSFVAMVQAVLPPASERLPEPAPLCIDGNEAVARVAYRLSEVIALYPITPATPMGEWADGWSAAGRPNLWGAVPSVVELQSEGGAAGAVHGALQAGALTTTFTASQGLLLMLPNLFRWAGERLPVVVQVAGRALAAQGLSIFGDHGDVMACRAAGCAVLVSASVQETGDFAAIAMALALQARLPLLHLFDGFRTSHEIQKVLPLPDALLEALIPPEAIEAHRARALNPSRPVLRGTTQNPDVYFQGRETVNGAYEALPDLLMAAMERFAALTGRRYRPYDYVGPADAERLVVLMGSACETAEATAAWLQARGERVGVLRVRLFRPLVAALLVQALPAGLRAIAVLERCKEPGAPGEPLYLDVVAALAEEWGRHHDGPPPRVVGGRYGLGSKEFTPAMARSVFDHLKTVMATAPGLPPPLNHFTVGIHDDLGHRSLPLDPDFVLEGSGEGGAPQRVSAGEAPRATAAVSAATATATSASATFQGSEVSLRSGVTALSVGPAPPSSASAPSPLGQALWQPATGEVRAVLHGLGSDGTVGASKATIRIVGEGTPLFVQGYFVYDSKKAGSVTVSHLRIAPRPIRAPYRIQCPTLVAVHHWDVLVRLDPLAGLEPGGTLLLNSPWNPAETWRRLPPHQRARIRQLELRVWQIDAARLAREAGMAGRINTVMQVAFFALSGVLPRREALAAITASIHHDYGRQGEAVVAMNLRAVEASLDQLQPLDWRALVDGEEEQAFGVVAGSGGAPPFVREVIGPLMAGRGDDLPVSALPCDGTWPTGTSRWEKRAIATAVPQWQSDLCVQCGQCVMVCPHAAIRAKVATPEALAAAPPDFQSVPARDPAFAGQQFTIQVAPEDCTGCKLCVEVCPSRDRQQPKRRALVMAPLEPLLDRGRQHWDFFLGLPEVPRAALNLHKVGQQQLQQPLFEFSGACAGCGETPYLKLASQLFGDRMVVANATGCSSIYGGNLPTTPWSTNAAGRGPAWCNSLFEDNAEFGFGLRVALDQQREMAAALLRKLAGLDSGTGAASPVLGSGAAAEEPSVAPGLAAAILAALDQQSDEPAIHAQRERVEALMRQLHTQLESLPAEGRAALPAARLLAIADSLVKTTVWLVGGDGWAYDIGFGGLDHVLASGRDVNVLVLDTEVYSNTGGQASKATPLGAVAKFAAGGKASAKKDLGLMAITYGTVYVASVAMGARDEHTIRAFLEAESYAGPSLIMAYSHCIAHGIAMERGMEQQRLAVASGRWPLYRHDPRRTEHGENPLQLDSPAPTIPLAEAMASEQRFRLLASTQPERSRELARQAQAGVDRRWALLQKLAGRA
jgi:pyruvate-ferredoxin/flavodoxin oxidoreductase